MVENVGVFSYFKRNFFLAKFNFSALADISAKIAMFFYVPYTVSTFLRSIVNSEKKINHTDSRSVIIATLHYN